MLNEFLNIYESGLRDANASLTIPEAIHRIVEKINLLIYFRSKKMLKTAEEKEVVQTVEVIEEVKQETVQEITVEATKEEIEATEEVEAIETTINFKTAESAFRNISFTPEKRAESIIAASNKEIKLFLSELLALAPEEKEEIIADVKDWALKYDNKKTA